MMTDTEQQLTDHLGRRAATVIPRYDLEAVERGIGRVEFVHLDNRPNRRPLLVPFVGAAAAALLVGAAVVGVLTQDDRSTTVTQDDPTTGTRPTVDSSPPGTVADEAPTSAFIGSWTSYDTDDSGQTMEIATAVDGAFEVTIHDAAAIGCSGFPSTMTGTGRLDSGDYLVIASPIFTCDDGSEPPLLHLERLRNLTFAHDPRSDVLSDSLGAWWWRDGRLSDAPMWPQSSVDEVRAAQELADAGDPTYTWQVDRQLSTGLWQEYLVRNPNTVEIVSRFLREELGWDSYLTFRGGDTSQGAGEFTLIDLVYLRCAPDETNPLYPIAEPGDTRGGDRCAPTIDELRYETVSLDLSQLAQQGPDGIWVVSRWRITAPVTQADPGVIEAAATARLEDFLRARIAGEGAAGYVRTLRSDEEVPLLYATTTGAPYERFEIELVSGPVWPDGWMEFTVRLYAEGGETVVEQGISGEPGDLSHIPRETTENGELLPVPYVFLDGEVTLSATAPWVVSRLSRCEVINAEGNQGCLHDMALDRSLEDSAERVELVREPRPVATGCAPGPVPADAEALAASLQSAPDLVVTTPVRVNIGGLDGLEMDVTVAPGASICRANGYASTLALVHGEGGYEGLPGVAADVGSRIRLYLLDTPEGSARPILAIAVVAPEASFETVVEAAAPILESIEVRRSGS